MEGINANINQILLESKVAREGEEGGERREGREETRHEEKSREEYEKGDEERGRKDRSKKLKNSSNKQNEKMGKRQGEEEK